MTVRHQTDRIVLTIIYCDAVCWDQDSARKRSCIAGKVRSSLSTTGMSDGSETPEYPQRAESFK